MKKVWLVLLLAVFMLPAASFANDRNHGDRHRGHYRDENRYRERHYSDSFRHNRRDYHHWRPYGYYRYWNPGYYYYGRHYRYGYRDD